MAAADHAGAAAPHESMIKKVRTEELEPGVFVYRFNCTWNHHPFLLNHKRIKSDKTIQRMLDWGIREVFIDTDKGLDVGEGPSLAEVVRAADAAITKIAASAPPPPSLHVPTHVEMARARRVRHEAMRFVHNMMEDIRQGRKIKMDQAYTMIDAMEDSIDTNRDALMYLMRIRKKDEYTVIHSINVGVLLLTMATMLGLKRESRVHLAMGGLLHDVGKIKVPEQILKKPEKLSPEEFVEIQRHALYSRSIFAASREVPPEAFRMALQHHERIDGSGYPFGLKGEAISVAAQMTAVADVYDALTADRCYRDGVAPINGLRFIYDGCGTLFNRKFAHFFIKAIGVYPVGSFVRLESGLIGIVVGSNANLLRPVVRVFYNEGRGWPVAPQDIDLAKPLAQGGGDRIVGHETRNKWKVDPMMLLR